MLILSLIVLPEDLNKLMAHNYSSTTYIVDRLIPAESIIILLGQSRIFKTNSLKYLIPIAEAYAA